MNLSLSPQQTNERLRISKSGDVLTINGQEYDFTQLLEGEVLPLGSVDCKWIASDVVRKDGHIQMLIVIPHGMNAPEETRFPENLIDVPDGEVALPAYEILEPVND